MIGATSVTLTAIVPCVGVNVYVSTNSEVPPPVAAGIFVSSLLFSVLGLTFGLGYMKYHYSNLIRGG